METVGGRLNHTRNSLGLQNLVVQRRQIYNDCTPLSSSSNVEMILISPEVTMDVPMDVHQDRLPVKQSA